MEAGHTPHTVTTRPLRGPRGDMYTDLPDIHGYP